MILIASGFVLRVILGGYAINVHVSNWIIITTFFLSIFLAFGKRYSEYNFKEYINIRHSKSQYDVNLISDEDVIDYTIPAEFNSKLFHRKGEIAAARMGDNVNPEKESSGCQFYIVQGKVYTEEELTLDINALYAQLQFC